MKTSSLFEVSLIHQPWWEDTHKILIPYAFKLIPLFYAKSPFDLYKTEGNKIKNSYLKSLKGSANYSCLLSHYIERRLCTFKK